MSRILALAFAFALGACAAPTASSSSPDLSSEPLPSGLRYSQITSTWLNALGDQDGAKEWSVMIQIRESLIAAEGVEPEATKGVSAYARRLIEAINLEWETDTAPHTAKAIEAFLHAQPVPKGMTLTVKAKRVDRGQPKAGLDLVQRDGSTG